MVPEAADRLRLQPAYDIVARHIRAARRCKVRV